jgi:hypothetical protein
MYIWNSIQQKLENIRLHLVREYAWNCISFYIQEQEPQLLVWPGSIGYYNEHIMEELI